MKFGELLQFQLLSLFNPMNSGGGTGPTGKNMQQTFYMFIIQMVTMFFMSIFEQILPTIFEDWKKRYVDKQIENTISTMTSRKESLADVSIGLQKKHEQNTVIIIRKWSNAEKNSSSSSSASRNSDLDIDESKEIADALLSHIASAENVPTLQLIQSSQFIINYKEKSVEILPDIYVKIDDFRMDADTLKMQHLVFRVTSNVYSTRHIRETLQNLRKQWIADQQNKLGDTLWYFEQKIRASRAPAMGMGEDGAMAERTRLEKVLNAPPVIQYEMRPFYSNKTFNNLFGKEAREIRDRIDFFMKHPEWYAKKGLPYQLGILLSGKPGTGKTAILRAIANRTRRHIINLKLSNLATATQLKNIFYNDYLSVSMDETGHDVKKLLIPPDKRIYVFEEIDTIGELVQERSLKMTADRTVLQDELTLGDILQILDGTIEIPGRILVMTSNYPERLDRALLRPGRIDVKVDFGFATAETIAEVIQMMLDVTVPLKDLPEKKLTVAEVLNIVFTFVHRQGHDVMADLVERLNERVLELHQDENKLKDMKKELRQQAKGKRSSVKKDTQSVERSQEKKGHNYVQEAIQNETTSQPLMSGPSTDLDICIHDLSETREEEGETTASEDETTAPVTTAIPTQNFGRLTIPPTPIPSGAGSPQNLVNFNPQASWTDGNLMGGMMENVQQKSTSRGTDMLPTFWLQDTGIPATM